MSVEVPELAICDFRFFFTFLRDQNFSQVFWHLLSKNRAGSALAPSRACSNRPKALGKGAAAARHACLVADKKLEIRITNYQIGNTL